MLAPSEVGWDLTLYAQEWLEERFRITLKLARDVEKKKSTRTVHDLRVACRRLRVAIGFFHGVAEVPPLSDVDRAARRMARSVRRLREIDVARKRLANLRIVSPPGHREASTEGLSKDLATRREELSKKKGKRIQKRATQLGFAIEEHLPLRVRPRATDLDPAREAELRSFVEMRVASRRREVEQLFNLARSRGQRAASDTEIERLHSIRVAIKHWRYASEIARAVMPRVLYRPMAMRLRHLQELGGKSQDFADLAAVVEKALDDGGTRQEKSILRTVRSECAQASRDFYEALKTLVPTGRGDNAG